VHLYRFYSLTDEHMEELGGVEFRALNALLWTIAIVCMMSRLSFDRLAKSRCSIIS
jgi:hypothetical protein